MQRQLDKFKGAARKFEIEDDPDHFKKRLVKHKPVPEKGGVGRAALFAVALMALATPCAAQQVGSDDYTFEAGVLVTASDVTTCAYRVVQPVTASVTEDYGADTRAKIFGKLRVLAIKAGADAVLLVTKGKTHMTAWAWNRREYTGRAVRYVDRKCAPES